MAGDRFTNPEAGMPHTSGNGIRRITAAIKKAIAKLTRKST
jgi:hypothetical protein